jgi:type I restriction-modification system DNA methylase subunit
MLLPQNIHKMNPHQLNKAIEAFIDAEKSRTQFTETELSFLSMYEGSGGLVKHGAQGRGILNEFFTPAWLVELMWQLAKAHGFDGGNILEPSCGTGRFFKPAPDKSHCVGFEINKYSAFIAEKRYPGVTVHNSFFEQAFMEFPRLTKRMKGVSTWLKEYPFSMVIGNPPYGKYFNEYSSFFKKPIMLQVELMFFYYGLQLLKPGGILMYLTSSNVLRNGQKYNEAKREIGKFADIVDAYRLPAVFEHSEVPTDIIVLKRKS